MKVDLLIGFTRANAGTNSGGLPFPCQEAMSQYRKVRMYRPRVISNAVRNLRSLTFVRDDNLMFSTLRHSLQGGKNLTENIVEEAERFVASRG